MHTNNNEIIARLRKYMEDKELTYRVLAKTLNIPNTTLSSYLNNKSDIQKIFILLHLKAGINLEWLITGKGKPEKTIFDLETKIKIFVTDLRINLENELDKNFKELYNAKMPNFATQQDFDLEVYHKAQVEVEIGKDLVDYKDEIGNIILSTYRNVFDVGYTFTHSD